VKFGKASPFETRIALCAQALRLGAALYWMCEERSGDTKKRSVSYRGTRMVDRGKEEVTEA
jgi:hypothetical protein